MSFCYHIQTSDSKNRRSIKNPEEYKKSEIGFSKLNWNAILKQTHVS